MKTRLILPAFALLCGVPFFTHAAEEQPSANQAIDLTTGEWESVVNIDCSVLVPDYREPWNAGQPSGGSGTGLPSRVLQLPASLILPPAISRVG